MAAREQPIAGAPTRSSWALRRVLEEDCFVILAIALTLTAVVVSAPAAMVVPDTWLALVDGRWIVEHGLPHIDHLTMWTNGVHWVDQQWLAQLGFYGLARLGGLKLCVAAALALDALALVGAAVAARRLGASASSVALAALLPLVIGPWLLQARTQSFALPLFVAVYALIAADSRRPTRRVLAVIPLLVLWANLHGSVVVGAALVCLHGVLELVRRRRGSGLLLAVLAPATLVASPYGLDLVGYYHTMLIGSPLGKYVLEWGPTHLDAGSAPFFALAFLSVYLLARHGSAVSPLERIAIPVFVLLGLIAERNTIWLGLACVITAPTLFDRALGPSLQLTTAMRRMNLVLSTLVLAVAALVAVAVLSRPASALLARWPHEGAAKVAAAAGTSGRVLADDAHSDWLLWEEPSLTGRIAYDVRFELFTRRQFARVRDFRDGLLPRLSSPYAVLTFPDTASRHQLTPSRAVVYRGASFIVVGR